ncbi:MAG: hypothetical protein ACOY0R_00900 [Chloroflexota bacterium]
MKKNPLSNLLTALTFLLTAFLLSRPPVDADLWWHLRAGQVMWEQKSVLLADVFSYTRAGAPWVNAFWLSELLLYSLHRLGGYFALAAFVALLGALTFRVVSKNLKGNPFADSFLLLLAVITAAPVWGPRPQILSFLLVALLDFWLLRSPRRQWMLVPFFALWANLHGGWIWGFLLLAAHIAGLFAQSLLLDRERIPLRRLALRLLGWTALSALAVGLNPNGLSLWALPFQQVNVSLQIQEWLSPDFHRVDFHPLLWMLFLLILVAPFAKKPLNWPQIFKTLGFAYLTFVAQRNIALFAIVAAPLLSEWIQAFMESLPQKESRPAKELDPRLSSILDATLLIVLSLAALGNLFLISQPERVEENYPVAAVEWMQTNRPTGRLFNSYNWGGYLLWTLPEYPVFIDGRADMYGDDLLNQWHTVVDADGNALSILDRWEVQVVFLEPHWPIVGVLKQNGWQVQLEDEQAVILTR